MVVLPFFWEPTRVPPRAAFDGKAVGCAKRGLANIWRIWRDRATKQTALFQPNPSGQAGFWPLTFVAVSPHSIQLFGRAGFAAGAKIRHVAARWHSA